jgi:hypothetical protein
MEIIVKEDQLIWFSAHIFVKDTNNLIRRLGGWLKDKKQFHLRNYDSGKNVILIFGVKSDEEKQSLKLELNEQLGTIITKPQNTNHFDENPKTSWFLLKPQNHFEFSKEFFFDIMEVGGTENLKIAKDFFVLVSSVVQGFIYEDEDYNSENYINESIVITVCLVKFMTNSRVDFNQFFHYLFNKTVNSLDLGEEDKKVLNNGLEETFSSQREGISGFIDSVYEMLDTPNEIEEEWLGKFANGFVELGEEFKKIKIMNAYFTPEGFKFNPSYESSFEDQELWPVIEYFVRTINNVFDISNGEELNQLYILNLVN